jgi:N-acetylhexosamine 1-kinase
MKKLVSNIFSLFFDASNIIHVEVIPTGIINSTYKVSSNHGVFILQRMNQKVFPKIHSLLNNKLKIIEYLKENDYPTINYIPAKDGLFYVQIDDAIWQLSTYIPSLVKERMDSPAIAEKVGVFLANFHKNIVDFPVSELEYTLPDFHNTLQRYADFLQSVTIASTERLTTAEIEIDNLKRYFKKIKRVAVAIQNEVIPLRVVHNDTKIGNILFDEKGNCICIIDFDTIMPGSILHDIGDALRSGVNTSSEDEKDLTKVNFDKSIYEAFMKGYIREAKVFMTTDEMEMCHLSLPLLLFEQSCRFLGDYLNNDSYYATSYEQHNLIRAKTQLHLFNQVCTYFKL